MAPGATPTGKDLALGTERFFWGTTPLRGVSTDRTVGPDNVRGAIDGDDLRAAGLGDLFETLDAAVDPDAGRNVAVVSEPYAGREVLLDDVATDGVVLLLLTVIGVRLVLGGAGVV